jgi:hypothetical protein
VAKLADILGADREASIEMLRVLEVVERIWHCPLQNASPFECLDWLLRNKARFLKSWSHHFIGNIHLQLAIAKEVLEKLKSKGNHRPLAQHEAVLRREISLKLWGCPRSKERPLVKNPEFFGSGRAMRALMGFSSNFIKFIGI